MTSFEEKWIGRKFIAYLSGGGDTFDHAHVDEYPRNYQRQRYLPIEDLRRIYVLRYHQCCTVPEILRRTALLVDLNFFWLVYISFKKKKGEENKMSRGGRVKNLCPYIRFA